MQRGSAAKFICPECGRTIPYLRAVPDGYLNPNKDPAGVWVCPSCWDPRPLAEDPITVKPDYKPLKHPGHRRIEDFTEVPEAQANTTYDDNPE